LKRIIIISSLLLLCAITSWSYGCSSSQIPTTPDITDNVTAVTEPSTDNTSTAPEQTQQHDASAILEVVYFHMQQRCVTCLCFEERISTVISENFSDEIENGKLVYKIIDITDKDNEPIIIKYQAFGSQLFINKIIDNKDNIRNITEIWDWKCPKDKQGFDTKIKNLIEQKLQELNSQVPIE
jgi:hypothetical protein